MDATRTDERRRDGAARENGATRNNTTTNQRAEIDDFVHSLYTQTQDAVSRAKGSSQSGDDGGFNPHGRKKKRIDYTPATGSDPYIISTGQSQQSHGSENK